MNSAEHSTTRGQKEELRLGKTLAPLRRRAWMHEAFEGQGKQMKRGATSAAAVQHCAWVSQ